MAKAVRGRPPKTAKRKAPVPVKRKAAAAPLTSAAKFKALVDNLTTTELDELIKAATARKNEEIAGASQLPRRGQDQSRQPWNVSCRSRRSGQRNNRQEPGTAHGNHSQVSRSGNGGDMVGSWLSGKVDNRL